MNCVDWKYASASAIGESHTRRAQPCQDSSLAITINGSEGACLLLVAADGAGSAERSDEGSRTICEHLREEIEALYERGLTLSSITREFVVAWLEAFQSRIAEIAGRCEAETRAYATTVVAAIVADDVAVCFQIGDGAIVIADPEQPDDFTWVTWPLGGEYANTTYFATQADAHHHLQYEYLDRELHEVILFTDGVQRLALNIATKTTHAPFFEAILKPLRYEQPGPTEKINAALQMFLSSERVNSRTDDDKSLVIASRRAEQAEVTSDASC